MFIVTVKNIDVDSFALPTLYGKTTVQKYYFSLNPQEDRWFFFFRRAASAMSSITSSHVIPTRAGAMDWDLWLRCYCPFVLKEKDQKFKADINGLPHLAGAPPPIIADLIRNRPWPAHPAQWRVGVPALLLIKCSSALTAVPNRGDEHAVILDKIIDFVS